jgi:hypothetical protein
MRSKQWYYAQLRWAVMVASKQGLREWKDAVHIFLSEDEQTAFQQALEIGRLGEDTRLPNGCAVATHSLGDRTGSAEGDPSSSGGRSPHLVEAHSGFWEGERASEGRGCFERAR